MNKLIIIGAGGHGKVIADIAVKNGYENIGFLDDCATDNCIGFPVVGTVADAEKFNDGQTDFIIGIGDNAARKRIAEKFEVNWTSLVHPSAEIAFNVTLGTGTAVMAKAVVNSSAVIGNHCIINSASVVEHDNIIDNYVHISPGSVLGGNVHIGEESHIGIGAAVKNNVNICKKSLVGAGGVVVRDIEESGTYIGVPVKKLR